MNKRIVEENISKALDALNDAQNCKIVKDGKIVKTFRGAISTFGAAVTMGSFKAAVAFFSDNGASSVERAELLKAMNYIVNGEWIEATEIYQKISRLSGEQLSNTAEDFINAAVALKLAMNAFNLVKDSNNKEKDNEES